MPELPEVETMVAGLRHKVLGRRILRVWCDTPRIIKGQSVKSFLFKIKGAKIIGAERRGKNILISLSRGSPPKADPPRAEKSKSQKLILLVHPKMTGHFLIGKWKMMNGKWESSEKGPNREKVNGYIRLMLWLDNGMMLALSDVRKFAKVMLGEEAEILNSPDLKNIGPEPLQPSFSKERFVKIIGGKAGKIKQILMDQGVIAGIGNIYSDEILWLAKVHPSRQAKALKEKELNLIFKVMRSILDKAIEKRGSSMNNYRDLSGRRGRYGDTRLVYGRESESCTRCRAKIKRMKIGSRSAHFCPTCQK